MHQNSIMVVKPYKWESTADDLRSTYQTGCFESPSVQGGDCGNLGVYAAQASSEAEGIRICASTRPRDLAVPPPAIIGTAGRRGHGQRLESNPMVGIPREI